MIPLISTGVLFRDGAAYRSFMSANTWASNMICTSFIDKWFDVKNDVKNDVDAKDQLKIHFYNRQPHDDTVEIWVTTHVEGGVRWGYTHARAASKHSYYTYYSMGKLLRGYCCITAVLLVHYGWR